MKNVFCKMGTRPIHPTWLERLCKASKAVCSKQHGCRCFGLIAGWLALLAGYRRKDVRRWQRPGEDNHLHSYGISDPVVTVEHTSREAIS